MSARKCAENKSVYKVIDVELGKEILENGTEAAPVCQPFMKDGDAKLIKEAFLLWRPIRECAGNRGNLTSIIHLAVAQIAVEEVVLALRLLCPAFFDVVEDTELEVADIERDYGLKVAGIIDRTDQDLRCIQIRQFTAGGKTSAKCC